MSYVCFGDKRIECSVGKSLFDYADELLVRVPTSCKRSGECHECVVEVRQGMENLTARSGGEQFLKENYRLACQANIEKTNGNVEFNLLRRQPKILQSSISRKTTLDPLITKDDNGVFFGETQIDKFSKAIYGLAVDVGTTTVVFNVVDLDTGKVLYTGSFENPQRFGGSDTMHRISYDGEYRGELQQAIVASLNFELRDMRKRCGISRRNIYEIVIVGNSTMRDIFFGIDVQSIGEKPYKSIIQTEMERGQRITTALNVKASELGIQVFKGANVYGGPLIGCHVGSDVAADLIAIGIDKQEDDLMLIDVGTNTEIVVGNKDRLMAASCPAGPAFEGGLVTYAMPGYEGAVEHVEMIDGDIKWKTIGGVEPEGICGSGLIDLLAELRRTEEMNALGVFSEKRDRVTFIPEKGIFLSRSDVSALAQAKSANYCGQRIVLRKFGMPIEGISKLCLAGGFANYIDVQNAMRIGFIPTIPINRVDKVGNASLEGATLMLISKRLRKTAEELCNTTEHVELETTSDFFEIFVDGCMFNPLE